jgi:hypothetical protein
MRSDAVDAEKTGSDGIDPPAAKTGRPRLCCQCSCVICPLGMPCHPDGATNEPAGGLCRKASRRWPWLILGGRQRAVASMYVTPLMVLRDDLSAQNRASVTTQRRDFGRQYRENARVLGSRSRLKHHAAVPYSRPHCRSPGAVVARRRRKPTQADCSGTSAAGTARFPARPPPRETAGS